MASAARNVAARSIHIRIHPTARSLPERREVLRVLERFGEVEMFRSLKYDPTNPVPNSFLSILSTEEAAQAALEASPIRYRLIADPVPPSLSPDLECAPRGPSASASSSSSPNSPPPVSESVFELRISPSTHDHHATIASSPLHSTYTPISPLRSPIASDLSMRIPESIAKAGLIDWVTDSARVSSGARSLRTGKTRGTGGGGFEGEDEEKTTVQWGRGGAVGWEEMKKPWRLRDKEQARRQKDVPWVMRGLKSRPQADS